MNEQIVPGGVGSGDANALARLFNPRGIAIVGARQEPRGGGQPLHALRCYGYPGRIYPVNPKYRELAGLTCYSSLRDIDGPCDLAIIAISAEGAIDAVRVCGELRIPFAIIYSGSFREAGEAGTRRENELLRVARAAGVRLVGPNCLGIVNVPEHVYAAFGGMTRKPVLPAGSVSIVSQSGGLGRTIALRIAGGGVGFRYLISSGNEVDIATPEFIDACLEDSGTDIVVAYMEGVSDGRALMSVGRKAAHLGKTVIVWKVGNTSEGKLAAASHTASMTGRYEVYRAALKQAGIIEVRDLQEIADVVRALNSKRLPRGRRVALMSASGGAAIVFADAADEASLQMASLRAESVEILKKCDLQCSARGNPVDLPPGFLEDAIASKFCDAVQAVLDDENVDVLCVLFMTIVGKQALNGAHALASARNDSKKPILVFTSVSRDTSEEAYSVLEAARIPIVSSPAALARTASALSWSVEVRDQIVGDVGPVIGSCAPLQLAGTGGALNEADSKKLLQQYGIPISVDARVSATDPVAAIALQPPYAVKVLSSEILHKTEAGGVLLGVADRDGLAGAVKRVLANVSKTAPHAAIDGVLISEMITDGTEVLVGVVNDDVFGPVVALGLGGIWTEVLHDLSYRIAPFKCDVALSMIRELRAYPLFEGIRGKLPLDVDALAKTLVDVSRLAWELRDKVQELDVNPLFVRPRGKGVVAADALVVLRKA